MWSPLSPLENLATWSQEERHLLHNHPHMWHSPPADVSRMEIRCRILRRKSRMAPECGLEFSDHLGEPWRWSWLASSGFVCNSERWQCLVLVQPGIVFFSEWGSNSQGKSQYERSNMYFCVCASMYLKWPALGNSELKALGFAFEIFFVYNHARRYFPTFSFL